MSDDILNAIHFEGDEEAKDRVEKWLQKIQGSLEDDGGMEIEVFHFIAGSMEDEAPFAAVLVDPEKDTKRIAQEVIEQALEYAESIESGKVRFQCRIEGVRQRCNFTITVPEHETSDEVDEGPSMKGLVMQQMRHNQMLLKSQVAVMDKAATMFQGAAAMIARSCEDKDKRIQQLESGYLENVRVYEDLLSGKHVRDLEIEKMKNTERRFDAVANILSQGAPILLNKVLTGGKAKVFDEKRTSIELMLEGFLNTLKPDQLDKIMNSGVFTPEQVMGFIEIAQAVISRQQAEKEETENKAQTSNAPTS